jgi:hypothetical protein
MGYWKFTRNELKQPLGVGCIKSQNMGLVLIE